MATNNQWLCIKEGCKQVLGEVIGGEFHPVVPSEHIQTSGPNLTITCPRCGTKKVWYSSDPIVRSIYQLLDSMTFVMVKKFMREAREQE